MAIVVAIVLIALVFDYINGFHDAANSIATIVSTRVLTPRAAVVWAAFFNFIAFLIFPLHVANTIGTGVAKGGFGVLNSAGITKTAIFIVVSPVLGMVSGAALMVLVGWVLRAK